MAHRNVFNSAAERSRVERTVNIFNNVSRLACVSGLTCLGAILFGSSDPTLIGGAAFGLGTAIAINEGLKKKESLLKSARNDTYTP